MFFYFITFLKNFVVYFFITYWMYGHDPKIIQQLFLDQLKKEVPDDVKRQQIIDYFFKNPHKRWHKFHIVSPSPWPFYLSMSLLSLILHFVSLLYRDFTATFGFFFSLILLISIISLWFRDIIRESTYMGYHTLEVQMMHRTGFVLFLISEIMVFFGFFWAYFHFALSPSIFGGNIWPPEGIVFFFISENLGNELRLWYLLGSIHPRLDTVNPGLLETVNNSGYWLDDLSYYVYTAAFYDNINFLNFVYFDWRYLVNKMTLASQLMIKPENVENVSLTSSNNYYSYYNINFLNFLITPFMYKHFYLNIFCSGALINPFRIPFLNTVVLLTSGCILMWSHTCLRLRDYLSSIVGLSITLIFAMYFISCQIFEYTHAAFSINDGAYGSIFYMLTGLHGFHVLVGTIFLAVCLGRLIYQHFTSTNHFGFEAAIWYWHFVDVVWIFLYIFVYVWPNMYYFSLSTIDLALSPVSPAFNDSHEIILHTNFDNIKHQLPKFDYDQNISTNFNLKLKLIRESCQFFINPTLAGAPLYEFNVILRIRDEVEESNENFSFRELINDNHVLEMHNSKALSKCKLINKNHRVIEIYNYRINNTWRSVVSPINRFGGLKKLSSLNLNNKNGTNN